MTWTATNGIRIWTGENFPEPTDDELTQYGWNGVAAYERRPPQVGNKPCATCPTLIRSRNTHCRACHLAHRKNNATTPTPRNTDIDEMIVHRVLNGDWKLKTTKAEKIAICEEFVNRGGSLVQLGKLTGWRTERYYKVGRYTDKEAA